MDQIALSGRCHCKTISLRLDTSAGVDHLPVRACSCTYCAPRNQRWTSDPTGHVTIEVGDAGELSRYRFGTRTADFLVCRRCGVCVAAVCDTGAGTRAVINVACLDAVLPAAPVITSFDAESVEERLARRARSWTPASVEEPATAS